MSKCPTRRAGTTTTAVEGKRLGVNVLYCIAILTSRVSTLLLWCTGYAPLDEM